MADQRIDISSFNIHTNELFTEKYEIVDQKSIGKGTFGVLFKCKRKNTDQLVALKVLKAKN